MNDGDDLVIGTDEPTPRVYGNTLPPDAPEGLRVDAETLYRSPTPAEPPDRCPACGCTEPCRDHGLARPAAPAGSGAERRIDAMLADLVERRAIGVIGPLDELLDAIVAQRARAEAAERERDEAYASHSAVADIAIRGGIKGIGHLNRIATLEAALSAATAREAGLRALCEEALQVAEAYCPRQRDIGDCASCGALRARLASLAAPEGGET